MAIAYRDAAYNSMNVTTPDPDITVPGTVQAGDLGIYILCRDDSTAFTTTLSGWSDLVAPFASGNMYTNVLYRFRQSGDTNSLAPSTTVNVASWAAFWYSGVDSLGAIGSPTIRSGSQTTCTAASITTTRAGSTVLSLFAERASATGDLITALTEGEIRFENRGQASGTTGICSQHATDVAYANAGATNANVATFASGSTNGWGLQVELREPVVVSSDRPLVVGRKRGILLPA